MKIQQLAIKNYKSIRDLGLNCKRINIFLGQPNTGKSNILEALGLFTLFNNECRITELARMESMYNLFHDNNIDQPVEITSDKHRLKILMKENFEVYVETRLKTSIKNYDLYYDSQGKLLNPNPHYVSPVKYYKFRPDNFFYNKNTDFLRPPYGDNLVIMLLKHRELRKGIGELYSRFGYKFVINPQESSVLIQKEEEGVVISYPYTLGSSTLQHYNFYAAAIETNKDSILLFDEPETSSSTEYTNRLARKIAADPTNQYFLVTHSPHLTLALLQDAGDSVCLHYVHYKDYETRVKTIPAKEYPSITEHTQDVFANMEKFLGE